MNAGEGQSKASTFLHAAYLDTDHVFAPVTHCI